MKTYQKIISGGIVIASLSSLLSCDRKEQDLEKRVERSIYTSTESEQIGEDYERFRNGASHTAANLSFAGALSDKSFEELNGLYDQYRLRSGSDIGHSRNGASETASILVNATIINSEYGDPNVIMRDYKFFRQAGIDIGHSRDGASKTAAILVYATALNSGNPEKVLEVYERFRNESNTD